MRSERTTTGRGRTAVVYVGPPAVDADDTTTMSGALADEARSRALADGLEPLERFASTVAEADALLATHPDAVVVVHPGTRPYESSPGTGAALWNYLRAGAVLRLCAPRTGGRVRRPLARPGRRQLALPFVGPIDAASSGPETPAARQRLDDCRAFAEAEGLYWSPRWAADPVDARAFSESLTVIVHPEVAAPDPDTPDGLLWRWLRQGREILSGHHPWPPHHDLRATRLSASRDSWLAHAKGTGVDYERTLGSRLNTAPTYNRFTGDATGTVVQADHIGSLSIYSPPNSPPRPPRDTSQPLPHDGLFIRRNSAFGTRSLLGARDLIEQGVIIGQDQIRFDDFVAARTDQVPGPEGRDAVAVSHGVAAVEGDCRANDATTHFVEVTLKAADAPAGDVPAGEPLPVNFVFVVDVSLSMRGPKLDTVKSALEALHDALRPTDCLAVIAFNQQVRTVLPSVARQDLSPERFRRVVAGLTAEGGTDIDLAVRYGIDEVARNSVSGRTVDCLYLFSDGDPTSGERDWTTIRTNIAARLRGDLTLSCFGFGRDARMPELAALAGLAGGHSALVTRPEQVRTDLLGDLSRRDHLAAVDIQLKLDIAPEVEIRHLYGHDLVGDPRARAAVLREAARAGERARKDYGAEPLPDIVTDEKGIRIFAPDLAFEETYWVVLEVRVPPGHDLSELGSATVQYVDTVSREARRHELDLAATPTLTAETVTVHAVGLWTSEVTFHALDDLYEGDRDAATHRLSEHVRVLEAAHDRIPVPVFRDDRVTLTKLITLTGSLGHPISFSDTPHGSGMAPTLRMLNEFGRVRSGFVPRH
ncbi:VWA domain-containing protein [Streptomyces ossamyceticus]|uniref:VWA domain-containing protein n=1 Tax=Streptomyces ossamyceticus TaxID=249581 RepID=A0ABV2VES5_9ACTN